MNFRYTITEKPRKPPEAFDRSVHEAEILVEWDAGAPPRWEPYAFEHNETQVRELARHCFRCFADKPVEMNDNRLLELRYLGEGRWLVRIEDAYLD